MPSGRTRTATFQRVSADLAREFVAEQYDQELDGCIKRTEAFLKPASRTKPKNKNRWLAPR